MNVGVIDEPASARLNPGAHLAGDRGHDGGTLKNRTGKPAGDTGGFQQGRIRPIHRQQQWNPSGGRQAGGYPPVRVNQVGTGGDLMASSCPQRPPQA
jgi:hypothetical protein